MIHMVILIMIRIFRRRKSKCILYLFKLQHGNPYVITYFIFVQTFFPFKNSKIINSQNLSQVKPSVTFDFNPTPVTKLIAKPDCQA